MARPLEIVSWGLPLTYAYDALDRVTRAIYGSWLAADIAIVIVLSCLALVGGAATLRRRTP